MGFGNLTRRFRPQRRKWVWFCSFFFFLHFRGSFCEGLGLQHGLARSLWSGGRRSHLPGALVFGRWKGAMFFAGRAPAVVDLLDLLAHVTWLAAGASCAGRLSSWRGCVLMSVFLPVSRSVQFSGGLRRGQAAF